MKFEEKFKWIQELERLIGHKVVECLHRSFHLSVMKKVKHPKPNPIHKLLKEVGSQINLVSRLKKIDDFEVLYPDFTEIIYQKGQGKAPMMPIVDHKSSPNSWRRDRMNIEKPVLILKNVNAWLPRVH